MKKLIIGIFVSMLFSCSNYLETHDQNNLNQDAFWQTEEHLQMAVTAAYETMAVEEMYGRGFRDLDVISDNGYNEWAWMHYWDISVGQHHPGLDRIMWIWNDNYKGIRRANEVLDNAPNMPIKNSIKNTAIGETLFLRALYYSNLSMLYQNVPLVLTVMTPETVKMEKSSKEEVVEQIIEDLTQAIALLPNTGADVSRINKYAAYALRARVYLYNEMWEEAVKDAEVVMNSGKYQLINDYGFLFSRDGQNSKESILSVQFLSNLNAGEKFSGAWKNLPQSHFNVLPNLVFDYYTKNGLRPEDDPSATPFSKWSDDKGVLLSDAELAAQGLSKTDYRNEFSNRDPRLDLSVLRDGEPYIETVEWNSNVMQTRYGLQKYIREETGLYNDGDRNFMVLRYADVLLMYAEAKNELSGPSSEVYNAVNQIRNRVSMPNFPSNLSKEELREEIRHERRIELAFEGLRYFDELRWKTAKDDFTNKVIFHERYFDEGKHYVWPIPQTELDTNPSLTQNEGW